MSTQRKRSFSSYLIIRDFLPPLALLFRAFLIGFRALKLVPMLCFSLGVRALLLALEVVCLHVRELRALELDAHLLAQFVFHLEPNHELPRNSHN